MEFPPCCNGGRVANGCAQTVYEQRVEGLFRLGREWTGWKVKDGALIGPRGMRFTPATLALAWAYLTSASENRATKVHRPTILPDETAVITTNITGLQHRV